MAPQPHLCVILGCEAIASPAPNLQYNGSFHMTDWMGSELHWTCKLWYVNATTLAHQVTCRAHLRALPLFHPA
jgi:hypothetical protein